MNMNRRNHSADECKARQAAASYLHAARTAECPDDALEAASWAQCLAPGGIPAIRLGIRLLIQLDMIDEADALIARGLLLRPGDPILLEMQANSFLRLDRLQHAESTINRVIALRPKRLSARHTAAHIALCCKCPAEAVAHLGRALENTPGDDRTRRWLIEILLGEGNVPQAQEQLNQMRTFDPLMRARIMRRLGRERDAQDLLESVIRIPGEEERCALELIDLIELSGDHHTFKRLYDELIAISTRIRQRVMEARLRFGHTHTILDDLDPADSPADALIALVAGADTLNYDVAHGLLDCVRRAHSIDDEHVARLWRSAMIAGHAQLAAPPERAHEDQCNHNPLTMLLQSAMAALKEAAPSDIAADRHLAEISIALGIPIETVPAETQTISPPTDDTGDESKQTETDQHPLRRAA